MQGFEVPKALHLECQPFSVDDGLLTPTRKLRRPQVLLAASVPAVDALLLQLPRSFPAAAQAPFCPHACACGQLACRMRAAQGGWRVTAQAVWLPHPDAA